jgi:effector-binding domain-containing protein
MRLGKRKSSAFSFERAIQAHGPYEGLGGAWNEFISWIEANGHKTASDLYECYVVGPESSRDSANWRTELCRPVIE